MTEDGHPFCKWFPAVLSCAPVKRDRRERTQIMDLSLVRDGLQEIIYHGCIVVGGVWWMQCCGPIVMDVLSWTVCYGYFLLDAVS